MTSYKTSVKARPGGFTVIAKKIEKRKEIELSFSREGASSEKSNSERKVPKFP